MATAAATAAQPTGLQVKALDVKKVHVPIIGTSPLIMHNFSEKSKRQMLDAMQGVKKQKTVRVPEDDYEKAFYKIASEEGQPERYGFPVLGFKAATVSAARFYDKSVSMASLRQLLFFSGLRTEADPQELVEIIGTPHMREDVVRVGMGTADLRYRPEFEEWRATLEVKFIASAIDLSSVISLIDAGGLGVGVGEWRPEKSGLNGQYSVDPDREIVEVNGPFL
jgi:hypothetical protein